MSFVSRAVRPPQHRVPPRRRPPKRARRFGLLPIVAAFAALPGFFLTGMVAGEILKSMQSSHLVTEDINLPPVAAVHPDQFRLDVSNEAKSAYIDPSSIRLELARGWDQERLAFNDQTAMLYFSGPFFEEHKGENYNANAIGDLFLDDQLVIASPYSKPFANRRYYMAVTRNGQIAFGYGGWQPGFEERFSAFVGGLGYLFNEDGAAPDYSDPYKGFKQELHNMIPRERLLVGRDQSGHLIVMKTLPMPMSTAAWIAKSKGMIEAYYLDQGNKARFIVPGRLEDTPRYNLPYLLRIADKSSAPMFTSPAPPLDDYALHRHRRKRHRAIATADTDPVAAPSPSEEATPQPEATPADAPTPNSEPLPQETETPQLPED